MSDFLKRFTLEDGKCTVLKCRMQLVLDLILLNIKKSCIWWYIIFDL